MGSMGLGTSLFQGLLSHETLAPAMLKVQFRMHPLISEWPSQRFYGGQLLDGVSAEDRLPMPGLAWPDAGGMAFIPSSEAEGRTPDGSSKLNHGECNAVCLLLDHLLQYVPAEDIGVLTPYRGQVGLLKRALRGKVEVRTVDGYQGREKALIVMSCVRSNPEGRVGFLSDYRRLNVALTRAQRGLIVIGNRATLEHDPHWQDWLAFVD